MNRLKKLFGIGILAFGLGNTQPIYAQSGAAVHNLGLYGGEVRDIAIDSHSEYVYISTYSPNGFFISSDDGITWKGMPEGSDYGEPQGVELDDDGNIYMLGSTGLFVSADHGETVTEIGDVGPYGEQLAVDGDIILVGRTDGQVQVSQDSGATFTTHTIATGSTINYLSIDAAGTFFATANNMSSSTLYMSSDKGETWNQVDTSSADIDLDLVAASPVDAGFVLITSRDTSDFVYISLDSGATWTPTSISTFATGVTFDASGRVYAGVYYSDDLGATWSTIYNTTPTNRVSGLVVADPENAAHLFGASFGAIAISTDSGDSWIDSNEGITAVTVKDIAQSSDKTIVWVATNAGLAKTENFLSENVVWDFPLHYDYYPESVWVNPVDSAHVVVGGYTTVYVTFDSGTSWIEASGWNSDYAVQQLIATDGGETIYAAAAYQNYTDYKTGDVFKSIDGGLTWESLGFPDGAVQALALTSVGSLYAGAGTISINASGPTGIYAYVDAQWVRLENSPDIEISALAVDPTDDTRLYATAADFNTYGADGDNLSGFYISSDSGTTWTRVTEGLEDATKFRTLTVQYSEEGETRVYLGGADKLTNQGVIYKSIDAGVSFGEYYRGLKNEWIYAFLFDGLLTGNSTGAYGMSTRVSFKAAKKLVEVDGVQKMRIRVTLRDRSVKKALSNYRVALYKKKNGEWRFVKAKRTNDLGKTTFAVRPAKKSKYKVVFEPSSISAEEYVSSSRVVRVRALR